MLPADDLLRRLPSILQPVDSLRLQTLVFSSDLMELALARLVEIGSNFDIHSASAVERLSLFSEAWAIVDQVHVARQVLASLTQGHRAADTQAYLDDFEAAWFMRNKMDHLNTNFNNIAKAGGGSLPLFGFVSFFRPYPDRWEEGIAAREIRGDLITLSAGPLPAQARANLLFADINIKLPLGGLKLEAFDKALLLENAVERLRPILRRQSDDLGNRINEQIQDIAEKSGISPEELMQPVAGGTGGIAVSVDMGLILDEVTAS